jgi:hypothetical protein
LTTVSDANLDGRTLWTHMFWTHLRPEVNSLSALGLSVGRTLLDAPIYYTYIGVQNPSVQLLERFDVRLAIREKLTDSLHQVYDFLT